MSFLYHKKTKATITWVWGFFALLIAISMVFAYSGGIGATSGAPRSGNVAPATLPTNNIPDAPVAPAANVNFSIN